MDQQIVEQVRRFNRTVTEGIGVLDDRFLGRARPLGDSRLLWEIGAGGADVKTLRRRLGLATGSVSRTLRSLVREGLARVSRDDRGAPFATLTPSGLAEWAVLDSRSNAVAERILAPLNQEQSAALLQAMAKVAQLLQASMVRYTIEAPDTPDARWCFDQYFAELDRRFDGGFNPTLSIPADAHELIPPAGLLVVARLRNRPVGCAALKLHGRAPAEIKRMWVDPTARGFGLGGRLLAEFERHARDAGVRVVRLETNRALREAIALYRRAGYAEVDRFNDETYAHHWFEKRLW